jgi:hypothetical protein
MPPVGTDQQNQERRTSDRRSCIDRRQTIRRDLALLSELDQEIAATLMARYRIDELKSGDVSLLIGLLGKIEFSPNERDRMNITSLQ